MKSSSKRAIFAVLTFGLLAVTGPGRAGGRPGRECCRWRGALLPLRARDLGAGSGAGDLRTVGWISKAIPGFDFHGYAGSEYWMTTDGYIFHDTGSSFYDAAFQLPNGAILSGVTFFDYDNSATDDFRLFMSKYALPGNAPGPDVAGLHSSGVTETPGWQTVYFAFAAPETIKDWDSPNGAVYYQLRVKLAMSPEQQDASTRSATLRQPGPAPDSPAPGVATFTDVPTGHPFFKFVEALYASGITAGCGGCTPARRSPHPRPDGRLPGSSPRPTLAVFLNLVVRLTPPASPFRAPEAAKVSGECRGAVHPERDENRPRVNP